MSYLIAVLVRLVLLDNWWQPRKIARMFVVSRVMTTLVHNVQRVYSRNILNTILIDFINEKKTLGILPPTETILAPVPQ